MDGIIQVLNYLGITPDKIIPAIIVGGVFLYIIKKFFITEISKDLQMVIQESRDLHNAAKEMQLHLMGNGFSAQHSLEQKPIFEQYGQHNSPMQLNTKGKELLHNSHFDEAYLELKEKVFAQMNKMNLRTLYDYESGASRALFLLSNEPAMDKVKEYAVNHPTEPLELIFGVASWMIREDYAKYLKNKISSE